MSKMEAAVDASPLLERELVGLHALSREAPKIDAVVAQIARYSAELTLPQGTIHVLSVYADDPAESFAVKRSGTREAITMARMQKAAAIMQFKL